MFNAPSMNAELTTQTNQPLKDVASKLMNLVMLFLIVQLSSFAFRSY